MYIYLILGCRYIARSSFLSGSLGIVQANPLLFGKNFSQESIIK
ncbi:hypothetical protein AXFE_27020 [Acidithrix ferrooxidans]|uniref:Uncharacterized protein n=1 Tax=Acidithrix ferrooxidans TaxID=1280514 RepID=A0A0D8HEN7_9ACTN|nr:hypothetical protein AXFE_27020 [Acidithrix ferrooxidans]